MKGTHVNSSVWSFLNKPGNQKLLSWLGGGAVVVAGGIWAVVTYVWPAHPAPQVECVQQGIKIGGRVSGSTITNTTSGTVSASPCVENPKK